uniref:Uncharacterized protein n=1 Tax=Alexandrium andersonii TaxID=327968 RepID=A0A7S2IDE4_9DINO
MISSTAVGTLAGIHLASAKAATAAAATAAAAATPDVNFNVFDMPCDHAPASIVDALAEPELGPASAAEGTTTKLADLGMQWGLADLAAEAWAFARTTFTCNPTRPRCCGG